MEDQVLTLAEVAAMTRLSPATLRYHRHAGIGPRSFKLGRRVVYKQSDVIGWVEEQYGATSGSAR